jgi:nucleotide-binding universal stress UspA family protein
VTTPAGSPVVLIATDFSETAEEAARVASDYARGSAGRLHILHVVSPASDAVADARLERLAADVGGGMSVVTAVRSGVPAAAIVQYALQHGADLIVVGTHGRTGVSRALIGSVAERVVRTAPCPVLTVPRRWRRSAAAPAVVEVEGEAPHCIVCAKTSADLVCESCRARIRGEALERKQREERAGRA